ncbi:hypothetical protein V6N13_100254 [Hibiscus sabdariffa]
MIWARHICSSHAANSWPFTSSSPPFATANCFNLLKNQNVTSSSFSLVRTIANLFHRAWLVDISWIPREGNSLADWLAKKALGSSCQPLILDFHPPNLLLFLSADAHGASLMQNSPPLLSSSPPLPKGRCTQLHLRWVNER